MQQSIGIQGQHILQSLAAHAEEIGVENPDIFQAKWKGGRARKRMRGRSMLCNWLDHLGSRFASGKSRAAIEHAAKEVTSDHKKNLSLKRGSRGAWPSFLREYSWKSVCVNLQK
jgi:hypothetical protein